jgi:hypothetical protein
MARASARQTVRDIHPLTTLPFLQPVLMLNHYCSPMCTRHTCPCGSSDPDEYGSMEDCEIAVVSGAGFARATAFETESTYDYVAIDEVPYSGAGGTLAASGVPVSDAVTVAWHSDASEQRGAVEICGVACDDTSCGQHGVCGVSGASCVCSDGWGGDACDVRTAPRACQTRSCPSCPVLADNRGVAGGVFVCSSHHWGRCQMDLKRRTPSAAAAKVRTAGSSGVWRHIASPDLGPVRAVAMPTATQMQRCVTVRLFTSETATATARCSIGFLTATTLSGMWARPLPSPSAAAATI